MATILGYLKSLFTSTGAAVDAAVPAGTGSRTVGTVLIGLAAKMAPSLLSLVPPPYNAAIVALLPVVNQLVGVLAPLFALAHVARPSTPAA